MATFLVRRNMIIGTLYNFSAQATKSTNSSWVNMPKSVNSSMYSKNKLKRLLGCYQNEFYLSQMIKERS